MLIDLGNSCMPEVWHCDATQGRSTLLVLDAMGYDMVNTDGILTPESREKFADQVAVGLVDVEHPFEKDRIRFVTNNGRGVLAGRPYKNGLTVNLTPAESTHLHENVLNLASVEHGQVGIVRLDDEGLHHEIRTMPNATPPDATITGVVDFVINEARYSQKKQQR
jgi:hypothetical protein